METENKPGRPWQKSECETIIRRTEDTEFWDCYSCIRRDIGKLRRIAQTHGADITQLDPWSIRVTLPYAALSLRKFSPRLEALRIQKQGVNPFATHDEEPTT
jgi:hypothetical protein